MKMLTAENLPALLSMFIGDHTALHALTGALVAPSTNDYDYIPKGYTAVPGAAMGSTFKSVQFCTVDRSTFWVSNRYLRYDGDRFYMPATMVAKLNKGYRKTGTVTRKRNRAFYEDSKI